MAVRRTRAGEGARLRDVRLRALLESPAAFASSYERDGALAADEWERRASGVETATFVAEDRHGWWGLVTGLPEGATAHVVSMWVDPARRGAGLGAALLDAVLGWARAEGADQARLWVVDGNAAALALYRSFGFEPTGARQPVPSHPELAEQEMSVRLKPAGGVYAQRPGWA